MGVQTELGVCQQVESCFSEPNEHILTLQVWGYFSVCNQALNTN